MLLKTTIKIKQTINFIMRYLSFYLSVRILKDNKAKVIFVRTKKRLYFPGKNYKLAIFNRKQCTLIH